MHLIKNQLFYSLRLTALEAKTQQDYAATKEEILKNTKEAGERAKIETENLKTLKDTTELKRDELKGIYDNYKELADAVEELRNA